MMMRIAVVVVVAVAFDAEVVAVVVGESFVAVEFAGSVGIVVVDVA